MGAIPLLKTFMVIARNEVMGAIPELNATNTEIASLALAMTRRSMVSQSELTSFEKWYMKWITSKKQERCT